MPNSLTTIFYVLIPVAFGFLLNVLKDLIQGKMEESRERRERRRAFLRETLVDLSGVLLEWETVIKRLHGNKLEESSEAGAWTQKIAFRDPESEKLLTVRRRVENLAARTKDAELSRLITEARTEIDKALNAKSQEEASKHVQESAAYQRAASERAEELMLEHV